MATTILLSYTKKRGAVSRPSLCCDIPFLCDKIVQFYDDKTNIMWYNKKIDYGKLCPNERHSRK